MGQPTEWVRTHQVVDAGYATGHGSHGRGVVFAYADRPTVQIRRADGSTFNWIAELCVPVDDEGADEYADQVSFFRDITAERDLALWLHAEAAWQRDHYLTSIQEHNSAALICDDPKPPQFGPQHLHALTRARARIVKDARGFSDAHAKYNQKGLTQQAAQMMACNTACFEVQAYLKTLIDAIRADSEVPRG